MAVLCSREKNAAGLSCLPDGIGASLGRALRATPPAALLEVLHVKPKGGEHAYNKSEQHGYARAHPPRAWNRKASAGAAAGHELDPAARRHDRSPRTCWW